MPKPKHETPREYPPLYWRFLRILMHRRWAANIARLTLDGYLAESGWLASLQRQAVVDAQGRPVPWYTLPFVDFLAPRIRADWRIFEYGAGASTHYYATRVAKLWAVEHDAEFAHRLQRELPGHVRLLVHPEDSESYAAAINEMPERADFVSVDGRDRVRCVQRAMERLSPAGVLVLDDSERPQYAAGVAALMAAKFRSLEFWGVSVGTTQRKCSTVFYRDNNILGI